jgi:two-component system OmpR family sensor kinase
VQLGVHPADQQSMRLLWQLSRVTVNPNTLKLFYSQQGRLVYQADTGAGPDEAALVRALGPVTAANARSRAGRLSQVSAGGVSYRISYVPVNGAAGIPVRGIVLAASLADDQATLTRLASGEAIVTGIALLAVTACALAVLRLGLRPVGAMAAVATAIAEGDIDRRVPVKPRDSEVNQLAVALNRAFDERRSAEDRLRCFVADVSHELRTPLSTIRGWAELYFQDDGMTDPDGVRTAMSRIADEATRMGRLVEDLLLLARLDRQRPLSLSPVDVAAVAREVVADAQAIAPDRSITLMPIGSGEQTGVLGDAGRLGQLVRNLVGNALQHTPPSAAVRVTVAIRDDQVCLSVADDGPGIPEPERSRVFERSYRAAGTRDGADGHGLGLAIVRAIAEAHHGTIELRSDADQGSEFLLRLPAAGPSGNRQATGTAASATDARMGAFAS